MNPCKVSLHEWLYLSQAAGTSLFCGQIFQCLFRFVNPGNLHQCLVRNGVLCQIFSIPLQYFQSIGIIPPGMGPSECAADILMILVQRLIPAERIGDQRPGKTSQESLDIALAPGLSILV